MACAAQMSTVCAWQMSPRLRKQMFCTPLSNKVMIMMGYQSSVVTLTSVYKILAMYSSRVRGVCMRKHLCTQTEEESVTVECDAVIVGSGAGGGVAAALLAQAGMRVSASSGRRPLPAVA